MPCPLHRRALRHQLGRGPAPDATPQAAPALANDPGPAPAPPAVPPAVALVQGEALAEGGWYVEALDATAPCLALLPGLAQPGLAAALHALRARCHVQAGAPKQAVAEHTAAIQALMAAGAPPPPPNQLARLLLGRAALHESLEQLEAALGDAAQAAALHEPATRAAAALAAQRLRRACRDACRG